jgi:hypothetical protein
MFAFLNCVLALGFLALTVVMPFRFAGRTAKLLDGVRESIVRRATRTVFQTGGFKERGLLDCARVLGGLAAFLFLVLALRNGGLFENSPNAVWAVCLQGVLALASSAVLVLSAASIALVVPMARGYALLNRFGFQGLWVVDAKNPSREAREGIASRLRVSTRLALLDVTGFELLGKGRGPSGGLLYDALESLPQVPVEVLLLKPDARVLDPDEMVATVFQSILAEMSVSSNTYMKRIQATLDAVSALNEGRPPEAKIEVRLYTEKPMVRALLLDQSIFVWPWHPRESQVPVPVLEVLKETRVPTLYEAFRRHFARLWGPSAPLGGHGHPAGAAQKRSEKRVQVTVASP